MTSEITQAQRFPFITLPKQTSEASENDWTLHVRVFGPATPMSVWNDLHRLAYEGVVENFTGAAAGGDSWNEWCEPRRDDEPCALHVDFSARDRYQAGCIARSLLTALGSSYQWSDYSALSFANDWSIQQRVWT